MALGTGIPLSTGFDVNTNLPLDARYIAADLTERDSIPGTSRYRGLLCFVLSDQKLYWLRTGIQNENWEEFSTGSIKVVADEAARLAIPSGDRYEGMIVYEVATKKTWQLKGGITDGDWKTFGSGSGTGFGGKNYFVDPLFNENVDQTRVYKEFIFSYTEVFDGTYWFVRSGIDQKITWGSLVTVYTDGELPGGLSAGATYYAINGTNSLGFSTEPPADSEDTSNAVTLSSQGSGNHYVRVYEAGHFTPSVETTAPMANEGSLRIDYTYDGNSGAGEGVELLTKTIDREDRGKKHIYRVSKTLSANYPNEDLTVRVFDKTNGKLIYLTSNKIDRYRDTLIEVNIPSDCSEIAFSLHLESDNATDDWNGIFGIHHLSPDSVVPGFIGSEWKSDWTPVLKGSTTDPTTTSSWGRYKRVGDSLAIQASFIISGRGSGTYYLPLPNGLQIDWSKVAGGSGVLNPRQYSASIQGVSGQVALNIANNRIEFLSNNVAVDSSNPATLTRMETTFEVPIVGWDAGAVFSTTEVMNKGAKAFYTNGGQSIPSGAFTILNFETKVRDDLNNVTTGSDWKFTAKEQGSYNVQARVSWLVTAASASSSWQLAVYKNGAHFRTLDARSAFITNEQHLSLEGEIDIDLQPGDYIDIRASQFDGGPRGTTAVQTYVNIKQNFDPLKFAQYNESIGAKYKFITSKTSSPTQPLNFDTVVYDTTNGAVTTSPSAWKFSPKIPGKYLVQTGHYSAGPMVTTVVYKNGLPEDLLVTSAHSINVGIVNGGTEVDLKVGDYIDIRLDNNVTISSGYVVIRRVGD